MVPKHNLPRNNEYFVRLLDDFPQVLLLLLNFKVLNQKCSWNVCRDRQRVTITVYSIKWIKVMISTCSIEFGNFKLPRYNEHFFRYRGTSL